ncbi:MAG: hypothetical protein R2712_01370 [Vicinamibacterales bacterium]
MCRCVVPVLLACLVAPPAFAQARKTPAPSRSAGLSRVQADITCPSKLGLGVTTNREFCDVLTGRDPAAGVLVTVPPHRGPVTLTFELHNRHTYSAELVKEKRAFRQYTATIGVLSMDNTLIERAVIRSEFRSEADLFDRITGGAGPGGVKAVAPTGSEMITVQLPASVEGQVSLLGERLTVLRPEGTDTFVSEGRPIATISNVMLEFRPGPAPRKRPSRPGRQP